MARSLPPIYRGVMKTAQKLPEGWIMTFWTLPSGHRRYVALKATQVGKTANGEKRLLQERLVDVNGDEI